MILTRGILLMLTRIRVNCFMLVILNSIEILHLNILLIVMLDSVPSLVNVASIDFIHSYVKLRCSMHWLAIEFNV